MKSTHREETQKSAASQTQHRADFSQQNAIRAACRVTASMQQEISNYRSQLVSAS